MDVWRQIADYNWDIIYYYLLTRPNPMIQLFTGQCITQGELNGQPFVNHSRFGAFPVQIEGHTHLHDSLEAVTDNTEMKQEVSTTN